MGLTKSEAQMAYFLIMFLFEKAQNKAMKVLEKYSSSDLHDDCFKSVVELIQDAGLVCECYKVETSDGFILTLHRIPRNNAIPVLLRHGFQGDSGNFVYGGVNYGLAFELYHAGYDVYLANSRGNRYGKKHKSLDPDSDEFWAWSFDEIAKYDIPATG